MLSSAFGRGSVLLTTSGEVSIESVEVSTKYFTANITKYKVHICIVVPCRFKDHIVAQINRSVLFFVFFAAPQFVRVSLTKTLQWTAENRCERDVEWSRP